MTNSHLDKAFIDAVSALTWRKSLKNKSTMTERTSGSPPNSFLPTVDDAAGHQLVSVTLVSEAHYENGFFEVEQFSVLNDDMASG